MTGEKEYRVFVCRSNKDAYEGISWGGGRRTFKPKDQRLGHYPIQADRLEDWTLERGNESLEAKYLKGITGVWGILRRELAHERIIYDNVYPAFRRRTHMKHLEKFRHAQGHLVHSQDGLAVAHVLRT